MRNYNRVRTASRRICRFSDDNRRNQSADAFDDEVESREAAQIVPLASSLPEAAITYMDTVLDDVDPLVQVAMMDDCDVVLSLR